eukprot:5713644-Pyramimonas_sp.AAC.1
MLQWFPQDTRTRAPRGHGEARDRAQSVHLKRRRHTNSQFWPKPAEFKNAVVPRSTYIFAAVRHLFQMPPRKRPAAAPIRMELTKRGRPSGYVPEDDADIAEEQA